MELLALFGVIVFSTIGWTICLALKGVCTEGERIGQNLVEESIKARAEFDLMLQQALQATPKPQTNEAVERLTYRFELKTR